MSEYAIRALDASTWDAFARLAEKHNGMGFGGCWCTWFHSREGRPEGEMGRPWKERLVREGKAQPLWCSMATPRWRGVSTALPRSFRASITARNGRPVSRGEPPAYRITCIFVDRDYRLKGVAAAAVRGALDLIAKAGGGVVEGYPHDLQGEKIRSQFLYSATRSMFEEVGFSYERPKREEELRDAHSRFSRRSLLTGSRRVSPAAS